MHAQTEFTKLRIFFFNFPKNLSDKIFFFTIKFFLNFFFYFFASAKRLSLSGCLPATAVVVKRISLYCVWLCLAVVIFFIFVHNCFLPFFVYKSICINTASTFLCVLVKKIKGKNYCILLWIYAHDCMVVVHGTCSVSSLSLSRFYTHLLSIVWYLDPIFFFFFLFFSSRFILKLTIVSLPLCTCVVFFLNFFLYCK